MRKSGSRVVTGVFLAFLFGVSAAGVLWPEKGFSESENRYLQTKPEFVMKDLINGSYGTAYEAFLGDQFPLRDGWVGLKVKAEQAQLKKDVNGVYLAKDGYLIEKFEREDLEGPQLDKNIDAAAQFAARMGKKLGQEHVRVMMVPSASQVLTDKLPAFAAPYDQEQVTRRIREKLAETGAGTEMMVPVLEQMKEHSQEDIYYRTDHHWTAAGAYYGYEIWAESMGIEPWSREMFTEEIVSEDFLGTVYSKVNVKVRPDSIRLFLPKKEERYQVEYDGLPKVYDSLYNFKALEGKDKYGVYLDGNHGLTVINREASGSGETSGSREDSENSKSSENSGRKLLIVKDSFAHSFAPFAANHFDTVYMVDLRYFNMGIEEFMEENGVTDLLVLYQIPGFSTETTVSKLLWQG
ncbi:hypothetical protein GPL15_15165 [Clostridium sp. MCC353]|uniref:DHHW family protein n=1 Tax=Clostridium sp. MCC353 TaxID=2592646 RepID=UPI001C0165AE|nr:DHHW family protein [Clostridium sp. MCC353]MBT9777842.1 hypothetical protein [Clostridium sp. MCC353]